MARAAHPPAYRRTTLRKPRAGQPSRRGRIKRLTENAGAVGLFLGLVLSAISLYDALVRKPEADRLQAISQFNHTVSSAAKVRQELAQLHGVEPAVRMQTIAMATPRILNDIATARALLEVLDDDDVGIPQLVVLIHESMSVGDFLSAERFIETAVAKTDATPYLASEARRYQGRYHFAMGKAAQAREAYQAGARLLGDGVQTRAAQAYALSDLISMAYVYGDCKHLEADTLALRRLLGAEGVSAEARLQIIGALSTHFVQFQGHRCSPPASLEVIHPQAAAAPRAP